MHSITLKGTIHFSKLYEAFIILQSFWSIKTLVCLLKPVPLIEIIFPPELNPNFGSNDETTNGTLTVTLVFIIAKPFPMTFTVNL